MHEPERALRGQEGRVITAQAGRRFEPPDMLEHLRRVEPQDKMVIGPRAVGERHRHAEPTPKERLHSAPDGARDSPKCADQAQDHAAGENLAAHRAGQKVVHNFDQDTN
ncbi:MAG: hypothetical protein AAFR46_15690 [Pseudomonadota bacterium]